VGIPPHELERLLRRARPEPRPAFVAGLRRSLFDAPVARSHHRLQAVAVGWALAGALALGGLVLSVVGLLPLSSGERAEADRNCKTVLIERSERRPVFERGPDGELRVRRVLVQTPRYVRRCR
jgi:hypothetical protein